MTQSNQQMLGIQQTAINRALQMLHAAGCRFAVITPDGTKHGTLELAPEPKARTRIRAAHSLPVGALTAHTKKHIGGMQAGDCAVVPPLDGVPIESLRSAVTSWASREWGSGSYMSSVNNFTIEILRFE